MYKHKTTYRVCYADTDQMHYMYYGNYARLYEIGRVEAMRSLGFSYNDFEKSGIIMPVLSMESKFIAPARYDSLLEIETSVLEVPAVRIHFAYSIFDEQQQLLNQGKTSLVFINKENNRPCKAPTNFIAQLTPYFK